jgi:MFS family permease
VRLMPWTATLFIVAPIAGSLVNRVGERPLIVGGLLLQTIGMASIALMASPAMAYADMVPALVVAGTGVSMAIPATQSVVMGAVEPTEAGKASGTYNMVRQLGGVFGIAILVAVFTGAGGYASPQAFSDGFAPALAVTAGLALVGALSALGLPGRRRAVAPAPAAAVAEAAR